MPDMKRVLIVSPHFPPSTLAGVHRARHLAKHLPAVGWQPIVLCVHEKYHKETVDPELATMLPVDLEVVKTTALPLHFSRIIGIGDLSLRAFHSLRDSLQRILDVRPVDAIFITGSPYYPMMFSDWLKRRYRKPIVLDFQDPWVSDYGASRSRFSKEGVAHWLATQLEPRALRSASFVTSVSEVQNAEMALRYPWLDVAKMAAIPIGGDPDDYEQLRSRPHRDQSWWREPGKIHFSYVGTFLPRSGPTARALFAGLAQLRQVAPELTNRIRFNFVGTSNQPDNTRLHRFMPLAEAAGVADLVFEIPQRVPFLDALNILANSNIILLLGSDEPHYTASKIYPGLMSGRPFLSLFHNASSAHRILSEIGGGYTLSFASKEEIDGMCGQIASAIRELATVPDVVDKPRQEAIAPYLAPAVARRFADILDALVA